MLSFLLAMPDAFLRASSHSYHIRSLRERGHRLPPVFRFPLLPYCFRFPLLPYCFQIQLPTCRPICCRVHVARELHVFQKNS
ncbi:hypothetical protein [Methanimicrococcus hacksteinii]|uniref:hypothetical protein n=1 Tax=Methanimicrococcus hacksteinii TaxID=3028293 RepID=UPI00298F1713|nr:hypothetical protein [Methanimicrococcus sp. At1]